jgi:mono/diheme cytochrome c family protein
LAIALTFVAGRAHAAPSAAEVAQGGNLFSITCGSSFCHGEAGVGSRGPSLRNRNFTPDFVRNTVTNGRSGTPMPAFKDSLSPAELAMIVGYVMSLSPDNHNESATAPTTPAPAAPAPAVLSAKAQAGSAIFFDLSRPAGCALCHSYKEQGGPIGPDLTAVAKRTPRDIYQGIVKPTAANPDYPVVTMGTKDKPVLVIFKQKTDKVVQFYDLSSVPPVLRSFYAATIGMAPDVPATYPHDLSGYSKDDIASLITFLKSADPASKDVAPADFAQP